MGPQTEVDNECLLEVLRQAGENQRAYMDLRFKHFSTFVVLTTLLGVAAFQVDALARARWLPALVALGVTALFWRLDSRTAAFQRAAAATVEKIERLLRAPDGLPQPPDTRFGASKVTNTLFAVIVVWWIAVTIALAIAPTRVASGTSAVDSTTTARVTATPPRDTSKTEPR